MLWFVIPGVHENTKEGGYFIFLEGVFYVFVIFMCLYGWFY